MLLYGADTPLDNIMHLPAQVYLNKGLDNIGLEPAMKQLELTPDDLEVPIPPCFREDRAEVRLPAGLGIGLLLVNVEVYDSTQYPSADLPAAGVERPFSRFSCAPCSEGGVCHG